MNLKFFRIPWSLIIISLSATLYSNESFSEVTDPSVSKAESNIRLLDKLLESGSGCDPEKFVVLKETVSEFNLKQKFQNILSALKDNNCTGALTLNNSIWKKLESSVAVSDGIASTGEKNDGWFSNAVGAVSDGFKVVAVGAANLSDSTRITIEGELHEFFDSEKCQNGLAQAYGEIIENLRYLRNPGNCAPIQVAKSAAVQIVARSEGIQLPGTTLESNSKGGSKSLNSNPPGVK